MEVSLPQAMEMYEKMLLIREFDERAKKLIETGDVMGEVHQYIGQEAVAVGVCSALRPDDIITSNHRGHGHIIAKGGDVKYMMAELAGKKTGYCKGKGGSMHIASIELGIYGAKGIVGAGAPIAVGAAFASIYNGTNRVAVCFFGDGALNQGVVHEAMNLAGIYKLPVIFVCENNHYAVSFPVEASTACKDIVKRAQAYDMAGYTVDGMDVFSVHNAALEAITNARSGKGPSFIVADTYRYYGHFSAEEAMLAGRKYRSDKEVSAWRQKDPIHRLENWLLEHGASQDDLLQINIKVKSAIDQAVEFARTSPLPDPQEAYSDAYAVYESQLPVRGW